MSGKHGGDVYGENPVRLDFSVNVNPLGAPEPVLKAARDSIGDCFRYPDTRCGALRKAVSSWYEIPGEKIIFSNGAAELIFAVVRAAAPKRVVLLAPSFLEYAAALKSVGAEIQYFYLKEENRFALPVEEYLEFLRVQKPQLIFLCSPSNPVGTLLRREELDRILDFCEAERIFAVVDECFLEFLESPEERSALKRIRSGMEGLMVIQALTKTFALAGLRIGYGFLNDRELMEKMQSSMQPWAVSIPAQAAGAASFLPGRREYLEETRAFLAEEKPVLERGMRALGFTVYGGAANYLLFKDMPGKAPERLYFQLLTRGILIRCCENYEGLDGSFYRICVRNRRENRELLDIIGTCL